MYKCKCGKEYENKQSYVAHCGHCKTNLGHDPRDRFGDSRAWSRGRDKNDPIYGESIRRIAESVSRRNAKCNPLIEWNKNKPKSALFNQSRTRKQRYASGDLTPARGVGRGKYSYLRYSGKRIMLRSTYEFIYALYLLYQGVDFEYESVRSEYLGRTYISDFLIDNLIVEIKGNYHADTSKSRAAFETLGYSYEVKFWKDLIPCYNYLKDRIDIDSILSKIKEGHDSRNYYEYEFNPLLSR